MYAHLFYFSIILTAYGFGRFGGLLVGIAAGLLVGPLMPFDVIHNIQQTSVNWELRLVFFASFGFLAGLLFERFRKQQKYLDEIGTSIISSLAKATEARDKYTNGHCINVMKLAVALSRELKLSRTEETNIKWASLIHDIGKIAVPEEVLNKPGKLTEEEYKIIQKHPLTGAKIIEPIENLSVIMPGIKYHHEAVDGTGYPFGLKGEEIPIQAKIIAVADVWDALTSDRPYRKGMPAEIAAGILRNMAGKKLDATLVSIFLKKVVRVKDEAK
ncbi:HD-GYP domain-containing protein [Niallia sp. 03133]|uniref:HD-GYP domain-containing protein n=1 Tax=Niallia sp. 03133 TaxID=3458060 RepID=UPI0040440164